MTNSRMAAPLLFCTTVLAVLAALPAGAQDSSDAIEAARKALLSDRKKVFDQAMNALLSDEQKDAFWSIYVSWESERSVLDDKALRLIQEYRDNATNLSEAEVTRLIEEGAELSRQSLDLRMKYFHLLSAKLSPTIAARFHQVDNLLQTAAKVNLLSSIPFFGENRRR